MDVRKTVFTKEIITADEMGQTCTPITRVAALAVVKNPFAGIAQTDLAALFDVGAQLGGSLTEELVIMLGGSPLCYGKAALVGTSGAMEHGAAVLHPALGKPRACGGWGWRILDAIQPQGWRLGGQH